MEPRPHDDDPARPAHATDPISSPVEPNKNTSPDSTFPSDLLTSFTLTTTTKGPSKDPSPPEPEKTSSHVVTFDETFETVAMKYKTTVPHLKALNSNVRVLQVGKRIVVPDVGGASARPSEDTQTRTKPRLILNSSRSESPGLTSLRVQSVVPRKTFRRSTPFSATDRAIASVTVLCCRKSGHQILGELNLTPDRCSFRPDARVVKGKASRGYRYAFTFEPENIRKCALVGLPPLPSTVVTLPSFLRALSFSAEAKAEPRPAAVLVKSIRAPKFASSARRLPEASRGPRVLDPKTLQRFLVSRGADKPELFPRISELFGRVVDDTASPRCRSRSASPLRSSRASSPLPGDACAAAMAHTLDDVALETGAFKGTEVPPQSPQPYLVVQLHNGALRIFFGAPSALRRFYKKFVQITIRAKDSFAERRARDLNNEVINTVHKNRQPYHLQALAPYMSSSTCFGRLAHLSVFDVKVEQAALDSLTGSDSFSFESFTETTEENEPKLMPLRARRMLQHHIWERSCPRETRKAKAPEARALPTTLNPRVSASPTVCHTRGYHHNEIGLITSTPWGTSDQDTRLHYEKATAYRRRGGRPTIVCAHGVYVRDCEICSKKYFGKFARPRQTDVPSHCERIPCMCRPSSHVHRSLDIHEGKLFAPPFLYRHHHSSIVTNPKFFLLPKKQRENLVRLRKSRSIQFRDGVRQKFNDEPGFRQFNIPDVLLDRLPRVRGYQGDAGQPDASPASPASSRRTFIGVANLTFSPKLLPASGVQQSTGAAEPFEDSEVSASEVDVANLFNDSADAQAVREVTEELREYLAHFEEGRRRLKLGVVEAVSEARNGTHNEFYAMSRPKAGAFSRRQNVLTLINRTNLELKTLLYAAIMKYDEMGEGQAAPPVKFFKGEASEVASREALRFIVSLFPEREQSMQWKLVYSSSLDGRSLQTLYRSARLVRGPTVLLIRTSGPEPSAFGCFASHPWDPAFGNHYGSKECFVFRLGAAAAVWCWQEDVPPHFQLSQKEYLSMGSAPAIRLDDSLFVSSMASATFDSPPLLPGAANPFEGVRARTVELWRFDIDIQ
eukprot:gnl/Chilomastix_cuspidata/18.p1 GENE.gnl/Chilomastix_cuspidata/18~~gnl/Chilomastix_cuspidata/18.p1  ORF type:complete len:1071 (+),score=455.77 gnl/Chilomastix_cuspidata/18:1649-4861(+)